MNTPQLVILFVIAMVTGVPAVSVSHSAVVADGPDVHGKASPSSGKYTKQTSEEDSSFRVKSAGRVPASETIDRRSLDGLTAQLDELLIRARNEHKQATRRLLKTDAVDGRKTPPKKPLNAPSGDGENTGINEKQSAENRESGVEPHHPPELPPMSAATSDMSGPAQRRGDRIDDVENPKGKRDAKASDDEVKLEAQNGRVTGYEKSQRHNDKDDGWHELDASKSLAADSHRRERRWVYENEDDDEEEEADVWNKFSRREDKLDERRRRWRRAASRESVADDEENEDVYFIIKHSPNPDLVARSRRIRRNADTSAATMDDASKIKRLGAAVEEAAKTEEEVEEALASEKSAEKGRAKKVNEEWSKVKRQDAKMAQQSRQHKRYYDDYAAGDEDDALEEDEDAKTKRDDDDYTADDVEEDDVDKKTKRDDDDYENDDQLEDADEAVDRSRRYYDDYDKADDSQQQRSRRYYFDDDNDKKQMAKRDDDDDDDGGEDDVVDRSSRYYDYDASDVQGQEQAGDEEQEEEEDEEEEEEEDSQSKREAMQSAKRDEKKQAAMSDKVAAERSAKGVAADLQSDAAANAIDKKSDKEKMSEKQQQQLQQASSLAKERAARDIEDVMRVRRDVAIAGDRLGRPEVLLSAAGVDEKQQEALTQDEFDNLDEIDLENPVDQAKSNSEGHEGREKVEVDVSADRLQVAPASGGFRNRRSSAVSANRQLMRQRRDGSLTVERDQAASSADASISEEGLNYLLARILGKPAEVSATHLVYLYYFSQRHHTR